MRSHSGIDVCRPCAECDRGQCPVCPTGWGALGRAAGRGCDREADAPVRYVAPSALSPLPSALLVRLPLTPHPGGCTLDPKVCSLAQLTQYSRAHMSLVICRPVKPGQFLTMSAGKRPETQAQRVEDRGGVRMQRVDGASGCARASTWLHTHRHGAAQRTVDGQQQRAGGPECALRPRSACGPCQYHASLVVSAVVDST